MTKKTYRVLNPRSIDPKVRIIGAQYGGIEYEWFEGEEFTPPAGMQREDIQWLLHTGLIEEVT